MLLKINGIVHEMKELLIKNTLIKGKRTTDHGVVKKVSLKKYNYTIEGRPSPILTLLLFVRSAHFFPKNHSLSSFPSN
jgi:hypothetical protein